MLLPRCVLAGNGIESRRAGTQTRRCDPGCGHLRRAPTLWQDIQHLAVPAPSWPSPQAGGAQVLWGQALGLHRVRLPLPDVSCLLGWLGEEVERCSLELELRHSQVLVSPEAPPGSSQDAAETATGWGAGAGKWWLLGRPPSKSSCVSMATGQGAWELAGKGSPGRGPSPSPLPSTWDGSQAGDPGGCWAQPLSQAQVQSPAPSPTSCSFPIIFGGALLAVACL